MTLKADGRTLIAEKRRAIPECVQSLPTKGMNWPRTSDLAKNIFQSQTVS